VTSVYSGSEGVLKTREAGTEPSRAVLLIFPEVPLW